MIDSTMNMEQKIIRTIFNAMISTRNITPTITSVEKSNTALRNMINPFEGYVLVTLLSFIVYFCFKMTDSLSAKVIELLTVAVESSFEERTISN